MLTKFKRPAAARSRAVLLTASATLVLFSTGCRSGMPRMNMFSFGSKPSAEDLAGSGPTTTYPAPPSASARPEAIASIAGGTSGLGNHPITSPASTAAPSKSQIAGIDVTPSYATPTTNTAAARANGFDSGTQPAGYNTPAKPSGYTFGSKSAGGSKTADTSVTPASSYAIPAITAPSTKSSESVYATPPSYTPPASSYAKTPAAAPSSGGFTLPSNLPSDFSGDVASAGAATAEASTLSAPAPAITTPPAVPAAASIETPASSSPAITTATAPSASTPSVPAPSYVTPGSATGYAPGSTASGQSYPSGRYSTPSTGGSFYR